MAELRELIDAVRSLHSLSNLITEYNPTDQDLEDLFHLKPDLKETYESIRNWIIPSVFDASVIAPEASPIVEEPVVVPTPILDAVEEETIAIEEKEPVETSDESSEQTTCDSEDIVPFVLDIIKSECEGLTQQEAWRIILPKILPKIGDSHSDEYYHAYDMVRKKYNRKLSDKIFVYENRKIKLITGEEIVDTIVPPIIGEGFFDKKEFLDMVYPMPKSGYVKIASALIEYDGDLEKLFTSSGYQSLTYKDYVDIATVKAAMIIAGKFTDYDDITITILVANAIKKYNKRKIKKIQSELKNKYGFIISADLWNSIVNKELHSEITDKFFD